MKTTITPVAMDTYKKEHVVALAYPDTGEIEVLHVRNTARDITRMVQRLQSHENKD